MATPSRRIHRGRKITVYLTDRELNALDVLTTDVRVRSGLAVDRGAIVREAVRIASSAHRRREFVRLFTDDT